MSDGQKIKITVGKTFQQKQFEPIHVEISLEDTVQGETAVFSDELGTQVLKLLRNELEKLPGYTPYVEAEEEPY